MNSLDTPYVVIDEATLDTNLKRMAQVAKAAGVRLRPHIKTHKTIEFAKRQIGLGAQGVTVAKLGEAEVMVAAGIDDILVAYPLVGSAKLQRFADLLHQGARLTVALDDVEVARGLSEVGASLQMQLPILFELDTGLHRMGKQGQEAIEEIKRIQALPFLRVIGTTSHAGHAYRVKTETERLQVVQEEVQQHIYVRDEMAKAGMELYEISVGATPTASLVASFPEITEMRPGNYIFNDVSQWSAEVVREEDCAMVVVATVVARPSKDRAVLDAGSKVLSQDLAAFHEGFGIIKEYPSATIVKLSEEHAVVHLQEGDFPRIGEVVHIVPNHACVVVNLTDTLWLKKGNELLPIPVAARGRVR